MCSVAQRHGNLINKMVTIDVGNHLGRLPLKATLTVVAYQWWLVAAFFWSFVPIIGAAIGTWMTYACAKYFGRAPFLGDWITARINFPYFYFWRYKLLRYGGAGDTGKYRISHPIFYCWGNKKVWAGAH
jgi:hypothetical protein